jgi:hypothetical protein
LSEPLAAQIVATIEEARVYFKCDGYQNEHGSDLDLVEWYLEEPETVVKAILAIVGGAAS